MRLARCVVADLIPDMYRNTDETGSLDLGSRSFAEWKADVKGYRFCNNPHSVCYEKMRSDEDRDQAFYKGFLSDM